MSAFYPYTMPVIDPLVPLPYVFVLVEPSHPGNIGSAARAIKTMGFTQLRVVAPAMLGALAHPDAMAFASGAADVLEQAASFDTLEAALADVSLAIGLSARTREFAPPLIDVAQAGVLAHEEVASAGAAARVAFVFGTERIGLTIEQAQRCHRLAQIDAEPAYSSLNLAQAVQIVAYELRRALGRTGTIALDAEHPDYATHAEIEQFFAHFREACVAVEFIDPDHPKKLFERMRRLFARTRLEREEVQLLRGLCKQMILKGRAAGPMKPRADSPSAPDPAP